jgi:O-antigen/teichoic acid export membrane protein
MLGFINAIGALISLLVTLYVARRLGPGALGVSAVVLGIVTSIQAFLDIRFTDVAGKIIEGEIEGDSSVQARRRAGILWLGLLGPAVLSLALALLAIILGPAVTPFFTETPVAWRWFVASALQTALASVAGAALYLLRFSGAFGMIAFCRLSSVILHALIMTSVLAIMPGLDGFFLAALVSTSARIVVILAAFFCIWGRRADVSFFTPDWRFAFEAFRRLRRLLWYGNLLGYVKMLQRSADVLVVAWLTGDRETGIYRFGRQIVDHGLAVLQEAFNEVNHPFLLRAFQRRDWRGFQRRAVRLTGVAALITIALVVGEALLLPMLVSSAVGGDYLAAVAPAMILTVSFLFIVGFHPALWAGFLGAGRLGFYTLAALTAVMAQYAVFFLLVRRGIPGPESAMFGHLAFHLLQTVLLLAVLRWRTPELFMMERRRS